MRKHTTSMFLPSYYRYVGGQLICEEYMLVPDLRAIQILHRTLHVAGSHILRRRNTLPDGCGDFRVLTIVRVSVSILIINLFQRDSAAVLAHLNSKIINHNDN